jgi:hypothetical protein
LASHVEGVSHDFLSVYTLFPLRNVPQFVEEDHVLRPNADLLFIGIELVGQFSVVLQTTPDLDVVLADNTVGVFAVLQLAVDFGKSLSMALQVDFLVVASENIVVSVR